MTARRILTLFFAAFVLAEARWHTKREIPSACNPNQNSSHIRCYCDYDLQRPELVKSADCYLTVIGVSPTDHIWDTVAQLKTANKLTLSNMKEIPLNYIPANTLKHLEELTQLDVKYGMIERIQPYAFANLSNIEMITILDSQVQVLQKHAFAHLPELTEIKLDRNNIVEINRDVFIDLPSLEKLFLTFNQITTIHDRAFIHLTNLKELEINMNKLFSLNNESFTGLKNLQKLDLSNNNLEVIGSNTFNPLKNLLTLNLEQNKIQMLDTGAFNGLVKLQYLSLGHNKLENLANDDVFVGLQGLNVLSLKENQMKELNRKAIAPLIDNFCQVSGFLDIDDNLFPCDCKLEWLMDIMKKTKSKTLKTALENLKCKPDSKVRELWNNVLESEASTEQSHDNDGAAMAEYDYYDDSQLNGSLFYTDLREIMKCVSPEAVEMTTQKMAVLVTAPKKHIDQVNQASKTTKSSPSTISSTISTTSVTPAPFVPKIEKTANTKTNRVTNHGVLNLSDDEPTRSTPVGINDNEISHESKPNSYTTSSLVNVSAKPNDLYENMPSDEALPDNLKAQRSHQRQDDMPSSGHWNSGCVVLISLLLCFRLFH